MVRGEEAGQGNDRGRWRRALAAAWVAAVLAGAGCALNFEPVPSESERASSEPAADPFVPELGPDATPEERACASMCKRTAEACEHTECYRECLESYVVYPACSSQVTSYASCIGAHFDHCTLVPIACLAARDGLELCITGQCDGSVAAGEHCRCTGMANGARYESSCAYQESGNVHCRCYIDDMEIGMCYREASADDACAPSAGCCAEQFSLDG